MSSCANTSCTVQEFICHGLLVEVLHENPELLIFNMSFQILNSIAATFGNVLALLAIWRTPSLHSPSNTLLFGLAVSNLGVACLAQPLHVVFQVSMYRDDRDVKSCAMNITGFFLNVFFSMVTLLIMTLISIDRYLAISLHLRYREIVTITKIRILLCFLWAVGCAAATVSFSTFEIFQWTVVALELFCLSVVFYTWIRIHKIVRRHRAQIQQQQIQIENQPFNMLKFRKSTLSCKLLIFIYWFCYLPQFICIFFFKFNREKNSFLALFISCTAVVLNSSLNPLIYFLRQEDIRTSVKQILRSITRCQEQH